MTKFRPIVISGPSGAGKTTLLKKMCEEFPGCFEFSVPHTTRKPRSGETNGKDYHFIEKEDFQKLIEQNGFLEHTEFSGNCYGTSKIAFENAQATGKIVVLVVDINGVKSIKKTDLNARYIFIQPPREELKSRLEGRGNETSESLQGRLDTAAEAIDYSTEPGVYDTIIINDDLEKAYQKLKDTLSEDIQKARSEG